MKFFVALALFVAVAVAAPPTARQSQDALATVLKQDSTIHPSGNYANQVETSNGIASQEEGNLKQVPGAETQSIAVRGSYQYIADDGITYQVNYIADENGFQPQGAHLPVAPVA